MKKLKFKRGEFITQSTSRNGAFAVFEGNVYEPSEKGGPSEYSLMCFYNPEHYTQDSDGKYNKEYVFECDVDNETCEYFIDDNDMQYWRSCTQAEITEALKFLAERKRIAFDEKTLTFRKMTQGETIHFGTPQNRGSESNINPFYRGNVHGRGFMGQTSNTDTKKYISRIVDENWEQKEPICNMDEERGEFLSKVCASLKHEYESYTTGVMIYPNNGSQIPRRQMFDACGWPIENVAAMFGNWCAYDGFD